MTTPINHRFATPAILKEICGQYIDSHITIDGFYSGDIYYLRLYAQLDKEEQDQKKRQSETTKILGKKEIGAGGYQERFEV